jgi:hypothetical protein
VYIDGEWYFTEYYPEKLNRAWFAADAAKATPGSENNGIFAVSYKPAECFFPVVWDENKKINAVEVTQRYLDVCSYAITRFPGDKRVKLEIEVYDEKGYSKNVDNRVAADLTIFCEGAQVGGGTSCGNKDDLNKAISFLVEPDKQYDITVVYKDKVKKSSFKIKASDEKVIIVL